MYVRPSNVMVRKSMTMLSNICELLLKLKVVCNCLGIQVFLNQKLICTKEKPSEYRSVFMQ